MVFLMQKYVVLYNVVCLYRPKYIDKYTHHQANELAEPAGYTNKQLTDTASAFEMFNKTKPFKITDLFFHFRRMLMKLIITSLQR
jgi:hypothetical protein